MHPADNELLRLLTVRTINSLLPELIYAFYPIQASDWTIPR